MVNMNKRLIHHLPKRSQIYVTMDDKKARSMAELHGLAEEAEKHAGESGSGVCLLWDYNAEHPAYLAFCSKIANDPGWTFYEGKFPLIFKLFQLLSSQRNKRGLEDESH
jgi:hypothetical protein